MTTQMRYRLLGRTGTRVSELCLGAMLFGSSASREEAAAIVRTFAEAGGNFIDTANRYANGESERIVGELLRGERDRWVLASKYGLSDDRSDPNGGGASRKNLRKAVDRTLQRLQTDHLDLYYLHVWDAYTPVEEVVVALDELVQAGKILYPAISDAPAWVVARAITMATERDRAPFAALQIPYSLVERTVEPELLTMARALDVAVVSWAPLGGGFLTGRYGTDRDRPTEGRQAAREQPSSKLAVADALNAVAAERGATPTQVGIAWLLDRQRLAQVIPILGIRTEAHLRDNLGALTIDLTDDERARLDAVSAVPTGFPTHFGGEQYAHGDALDRVVDHRDTIRPLL